MFGYANWPLVYGDLVLVAPLGEEMGLVALDRFLGEVAWTAGGIGSSHSTPCVLELLGRPQVLMLSSRIDPSVFGDPSGEVCGKSILELFSGG